MFNFVEALRRARAARQDGERGASAVEYGLLIAGIAAVIVVAVMALGPIVHDAFSSTCNEIQTHNSALSPSTSCDN